MTNPFHESPNDPIVENENGGKQSAQKFRYALFPWDALLLINEILVAGAEKYGYSEFTVYSKS